MKKKEKERNLDLWEHGTRLTCPHLRFQNNHFIALEKDPCPTCDHRSCHNAGQQFTPKDRLIILT